MLILAPHAARPTAVVFGRSRMAHLEEHFVVEFCESVSMGNATLG